MVVMKLLVVILVVLVILLLSVPSRGALWLTLAMEYASDEP